MGKYFDIIPPEGLGKKKNYRSERKRLKKEREKRIKEIKKETKNKEEKKRVSTNKTRKNIGFLIILVFGLGLFFYLSSYYSRAEIVLYPDFQIMKEKIPVIVSKDAKEISPDKKIIPGNYLEIKDTVSQEFSSTGKELSGKRARGKIRVFNEYSTKAISFRAKTRFMSASGKVFLSLNKFTVPGKKLREGKWVPGTVDIEVQAAQPGEDYNIDPTTFSIPGLAGTPLYTSFYAKSFEKMTGGSKNEVPKVTKEDIEKAKEETIKRLEEKEMEDLKQKEKNEGIYVFPETINQETIKDFSLVKEGAELAKFTYQAEGRTTAFYFKKDDLKKLVISYIKKRISEDEEINEKKLSITWKTKKVEKEGDVYLEVAFEAPIYKNFNLEELKKYVRGKKIKEAEVMLETEPGILKTAIKIHPSYIRKIPSRTKKIEMTISLD